MRKPKRNRGFTLIELMVVVVIISILAAIALPSYNDYVTRGRITQAIGGLADMRVKLEQYFQDNRSYVGACQAGTLAPLPANTDFFQFSCSNLGSTTYTVTALGVGSMAGFTYTIDQANVRTTVSTRSGWSGAGSSCWVVHRSGSCS